VRGDAARFWEAVAAQGGGGSGSALVDHDGAPPPLVALLPGVCEEQLVANLGAFGAFFLRGQAFDSYNMPSALNNLPKPTTPASSVFFPYKQTPSWQRWPKRAPQRAPCSSSPSFGSVTPPPL
jgi:hypothetical protein